MAIEFTLYWKTGLLMEEVRNKSVQLIYADTPFAINHTDSSAYNRTKDSIPYNEWTLEEYSYSIPILLYTAFKKLKDTGSLVLFCAWNRLPEVYRAIFIVNQSLYDQGQGGLMMLNSPIWRYQFGMSTTRKFTTSHYNVVWLVKSNKYKFNAFWTAEDIVKKRKRPYMEDVWTIDRKYHRGERTARNEQPLELATKIIQHFTNPRDLVVEFGVGSGTVLLASALSGRRWIGYETNTKLMNRIKRKCGLIAK